MRAHTHTHTHTHKCMQLHQLNCRYCFAPVTAVLQTVCVCMRECYNLTLIFNCCFDRGWMLRLNRLDLGAFFFFFAWFLTLAMLFSERERERGRFKCLLISVCSCSDLYSQTETSTFMTPRKLQIYSKLYTRLKGNRHVWDQQTHWNDSGLFLLHLCGFCGCPPWASEHLTGTWWD